jgi:hypothetical protein
MKNSSYEVRVIEPDEGKWLTQNSEVSATERVFSKKVFLAVNDSPSNWRECDDAYKAEIEAEVAAIEAAQIAAMEG